MAGKADIPSDHPSLRRALSLPLVALYGLGVTIGAGIYVLIGATAGRAGIHAPFAFLIAALVMAPTAATFAELTSRMPVSAGEAAYVRHAFGSRALALVVGLLVVTAGVVSASAVAIGAAGYIGVFVDLPANAVIAAVILAMGLAAAWGIVESVSVAAILTVIEIAGLVLIIGAGLMHDPALVARTPEVLPLAVDPDVWAGIFAAGLLAFFAFIGFEDMVNIAEEANDPLRTLPRAILVTLIVSTLLYFAVASVAVLSVPIDGLAASTAPLGFVYERVTGGSPLVISAIAIVATLNGIIVQMIMASRVLYGLASQGDLPSVIGSVNRMTRTPLVATGIVVGIVLLLGLVFPIEGLAEMTSRTTLTVFCLVNLALIRVKLRKEPAPDNAFQVGMWVPVSGLLASLALLAHDVVG